MSEIGETAAPVIETADVLSEFAASDFAESRDAVDNAGVIVSEFTGARGLALGASAFGAFPFSSRKAA